MNKIISCNLPLDMQKPHTSSEPIISLVSCFTVLLLGLLFSQPVLLSPLRAEWRLWIWMSIFFDKQTLNVSYFN